MPIQDSELQLIADQLKYAKKSNDLEKVERLLQERAEYKRKYRKGGATAPDKRPKTSAETTTTESASLIARRTETQSMRVTHGTHESTERKQEAIVEERSERTEIDGKISVANISTVINRETVTRRQRAWMECMHEVTAVNKVHTYTTHHTHIHINIRTYTYSK